MKIKTHILAFALVLTCTVVYGFGGSGEFGKWKLMLQKLKWSILPKTSEAVDLGSSSKKFGKLYVVDGYIDNIQGDTAGDWQVATDKVLADSGNWDDAYGKQVDTWTAPLDWTTKTASISNVNNSDTDGYLTHEQFAVLEDKYTQSQIIAYLLLKMDLTDTDIFALVDGTRAFTGQQDFQAGIKSDTVVESTVDAGVTIEGTLLKDNDINTGYIQVAENSGATTWTDMSVTDTPGAGVEQSRSIKCDGEFIAMPYAEADGSGGVKNLWWYMHMARLEPLATSPAEPQEGCFWWESTAADSGLNQYHGGAWERVLTDESGYTQTAADALLANKQALDTALTNISALAYVSASFIKLTADDTYAVRTLDETKTDLGKVIDSEETNLQTIMHGSVTVTTSSYDGTATITYGKTFTATPTVVVTVAETLNAGYDSIVNVEDIGIDTCIVRLIDCVDDDSSIAVGYIVMGDE